MIGIDFWIVRATYDSDTWYLFRKDNTEIKVKILFGGMYPNGHLTKDEQKYITENILSYSMKYHIQELVDDDQRRAVIINMHLMGMSDTAINNETYYGYNLINKVTTEYWDKKMDVKESKLIENIEINNFEVVNVE